MKTKIFNTLFVSVLGMFLFFSIQVSGDTSTPQPSENLTTASTQSPDVGNVNSTKKPKIKSTIKKITINKSVLRLNPKDKRSLKASYTDKKHEGIKWISKNPSIAKVNQKGVVTGRKKGTTYIYCMSKSKNDVVP